MKSFKIFRKAKERIKEKKIKAMFKKKEREKDNLFWLGCRAFLVKITRQEMIDSRKNEVRKISPGDLVRWAKDKKLAKEGEKIGSDLIISKRLREKNMSLKLKRVRMKRRKGKNFLSL